MSKEELTPEIQELKRAMEANGVKVVVTFNETRAKRLVRHMTTPWRLITGLPVAYATTWLAYQHHVAQGAFWMAYAAWIVAMFLVFWLYELHAWSGGRRLNG